MLMNFDCIKDILGYCITNIDFVHDGESWTVITVNLEQMYDADELKKYNKKDIMYSVSKLIECGYLRISSRFPDKTPYLDICIIEDVTITGHEFYNSFHNKKVWNKVKSIAKQTGNITLNVLTQISSKICLEMADGMIKNHLSI